jgi:hydroxyacylglutathione hydrolase
MSLRVEPVPCLKDNYAYLIICERSRVAAIVDPGEALPCMQAADRHGVSISAVWATHHHPDHVGGVVELLRQLGRIEVVAHQRDQERVPGASKLVDDGDEIVLGDMRAQILYNPGHTVGAISFVIGGAVFTGDTMFGAGCGRLFEGTAAMMQTSLQKIAALPPHTRVYFGHEYTASNLRFAAAVEPGNDAIVARATRPAPTTPSTIADEIATNPFVRTAEPAVIAAAQSQDPTVDGSDPAAVLGVIRTWKDGFKG